METKLFVSRSLHTVSLFAFLSLCQLAASVSFMLWSCVPLFLCRCIVKIFPALQIYLVAVLFLLFILSLVESLCSCTYLLTYCLVMCVCVFSVSVYNTQSISTWCAIQFLLSACMHRCVTYPLGDIHTSPVPASDLVVCA